ncbi:archaeal proteasome endopeptidase complex subunit alpha [Candidatus Woesearchaeota archaeon]|jgi:proteasome alpha subunit|nr:archaeal proteasome endopeptidase complex subunit alpha [Candidatus Woesearchaeota archaeon]MBT4321643.1 archaeal proteasome endopeptidase complex subunit alpha [Candidatus Woesearchaeota archaeon]MBT4631046.1 archaeal proteasome endopeptidase complex subunit alpha [Candidatus Woesearchaeota archaeon]
MQESVQHQMMGYDRASTMFSPDGRLLQVEYAKKTVKQGTPVLGIVCKDGVLLLADKRVIDKLIVVNSVEKVFQVDEHIAAAASGIMSDARILIEKAQVIAQQYRVAYDEPMEPHSLVKEVSNMKQAYTQYGGARPFGVSLLFAGVNDGPQLFLTDPTGIHWEYKATAIGEFEDELKEILSKNYKDNLSLVEGVKLATNALKKVLGKDFNLDRLDGCSIGTSDKKFKRLTKEYIRKCQK